MGDLAAAPGRSLLPVYAEAELGRPPYFTSALLSAQLLFSGIAAFAGGGLADALGFRRVTILGATGLPLLGAVFLIRSPLALVALWVYVGFAMGLYTIGRQSYMMAIAPRSHLATATALIFTALTLGSALGNSLAAPLVDRYGFRLVGLVTGGLALAVLAAVAAATPEPPRGGERIRSAQSFAGYGACLRRPGVLTVALMRLAATSYWGGATLLIPLLIYRAAGVPSAAAYYVTASFLFASVCQILAGRLLDRHGLGRSVTLLTAMLGGIAVATAAFAHSLVGLYVCGVLGAGIAWALATATPSVITDIAPPGERGRTLGLTQVATSIGMLTGTQVGGWLVDAYAGLPFLLIGLANLVMVFGAVRLARQLQGEAASGI